MPDLHPTLHDLFADADAVLLYCVDPGAFAIMDVVADALAGRSGIAWSLHGWTRTRVPERPSVAVTEFLATTAAQATRPLVLLGSQMHHADTHHVLLECRAAGCRTAFIFDHWSSATYAAHFVAEGRLVALPDLLLIMDAESQAALEEVLAPYVAITDLRPRIRLVGHPSVDRMVKRIQALPANHAQLFPDDADLHGRYVLVLLEPLQMDRGTGPDGRPLMGFDEWVFLEALPASLPPDCPLVAVRPHPRQDRTAVAAWLADHWPNISWCMADKPALEPLVAGADAVYGMTTSALIVAHAAGRPTHSLQPHRTEAGRAASNPFLERILIHPATT